MEAVIAMPERAFGSLPCRIVQVGGVGTKFVIVDALDSGGSGFVALVGQNGVPPDYPGRFESTMSWWYRGRAYCSGPVRRLASSVCAVPGATSILNGDMSTASPPSALPCDKGIICGIAGVLLRVPTDASLLL